MRFRPINVIRAASTRPVVTAHNKARMVRLLTLNDLHLNSFAANFFLAAALMLPVIAFSDGTNSAPPIGILYGAYEIIGRESGALAPTYRGWMRIAVEQDRLILDRCIDGTHTQGSGYLTTVTADKLPAVRFNYPRGDSQHEATCMYLNDFDNLPRFTCYTYPTKNPNPKPGHQLDLGPNPGMSGGISTDMTIGLESNSEVEVPGLESAFPIVWPVPINYFNCE